MNYELQMYYMTQMSHLLHVFHCIYKDMPWSSISWFKFFYNGFKFLYEVKLTCTNEIIILFFSVTGWRGKYITLVLILSCLLLIVHIAWHITLASFVPYGSLLESYPLIERIFHNLGLVSYINTPTLMGVHYLAPEVSDISIVSNLQFQLSLRWER